MWICTPPPPVTPGPGPVIGCTVRGSSGTAPSGGEACDAPSFCLQRGLYHFCCLPFEAGATSGRKNTGGPTGPGSHLQMQGAQYSA